jgi:hypothetical protein
MKQKEREQMEAKLNQFVQKLEIFDIKSGTQDQINSLLNWLLAIGTGFLLVIYSDIDSYISVGGTISKILVILSISTVLISIIILAINRLLFLVRDLSISNSKGVIRKIQFKLKEGTAKRSDFDKFDRQYNLWLKLIDMPKNVVKNVIPSIILLFLGIISFSLFIIWKIIA